MMAGAKAGHIVALCGGIGGAKLALGLSRVLAPEQLTVVVNTGDDFEHLGLHISPDLDTVLYTLGGIADPERGWGRAGETWNFMQALAGLDGENWFQLGDRDLAMHATRTSFLREGGTLSAFTAQAARKLGISVQIVPMSDDAVRTIVQTEEGDLPFQHYFVRRRCEPVVKAIRFEGARSASPAPGVLELLAGPAARAIVICPSNPYLSVDPILSVPGCAMRWPRASAGDRRVADHRWAGRKRTDCEDHARAWRVGYDRGYRGALSRSDRCARHRSCGCRRRHVRRSPGAGDADNDEKRGRPRAACTRGSGFCRGPSGLIV